MRRSRALLIFGWTVTLLAIATAPVRSDAAGRAHPAHLEAAPAVDVADAMYYVSQHKPGAKLGIIYQNDAYGGDGLKGFTAGVSAYHLDKVASATYNPTEIVMPDTSVSAINSAVTRSRITTAIVARISELSTEIRHALVGTPTGPRSARCSSHRTRGCAPRR